MESNEHLVRNTQGASPAFPSCATCKLRGERTLCNLEGTPLRELDRLRSKYPMKAGAIVYQEGQPAEGVFIVCQGQVKLLMSSPDGRSVIFRIVNPGETLGLSATLMGRVHESTAETVVDSHLSFVGRTKLLDFIGRHKEACARAVYTLSGLHQSACERFRSLAFGQTAMSRLANFFLEIRQKSTGPGKLVQLSLTHEELGQTLGISRETVTRILGDLRKRRILRFHRGTLEVFDRNRLVRLSAGAP